LALKPTYQTEGGSLRERAKTMFESLDEHIKHDDQAEASVKERVLKYVMISAVSIVLVGGLFAAVQFVK